MAAMEKGHEAKLTAVLATGMASFPAPGETADLHIADYQVETELNPVSSIEDVFLFSMKAEQKAFEMYTRLAQEAAAREIRELFAALAEGDKNHNLSLESEYEVGVMQET